MFSIHGTVTIFEMPWTDHRPTDVNFTNRDGKHKFNPQFGFEVIFIGPDRPTIDGFPDPYISLPFRDAPSVPDHFMAERQVWALNST
jgi:hypothetical protein